MSGPQRNAYLALTPPAGVDGLVPLRLCGEEAISEPFRFELEMLAGDGAVPPGKLVGERLTVAVGGAAGGVRQLNGVVSRFVQGGRDAGARRYTAELRPWLWLLGQRRDCRIFQNKTVVQIVKEVCKAAGHGDLRTALKGTCPKLDYVVQYNESDLAFVARLLEAHGLFYLFEHAAGRHTLVIGDDRDAFAACPSPADGALSYRPGGARAWSQSDVVTEAALEHGVTPEAVSLDDYDFVNPAADLAAAVGRGARAHYAYPGGHASKAAGGAAARRRLEELQAEGVRLCGASVARGLVAGHRFSLRGFHHADGNGDYVVRRVHHDATPEGYRNAFEAFPLDVPFRPPRRTPRPTVAGPQTAVVVGPPGKEIWTDKHGRIKVQFHWDRVGKRNDQSSCWIRVAQGWAGKGFGAFCLPRVGSEVVVGFLDGDPDRPLVIGGVHNGRLPAPHALPAQQTRTTLKSQTTPGGGGSNELTFDDKKGAEEVYLHAQRDFVSEVEHARRTTVKAGDDALTIARGNRTFKLARGDETHSVAGRRTVTVSKAEQHHDESNFTHKVKGNYVLKVQGNLTIEAGGSITLNAKRALTTKSSLATTAKAGTGVTIKAGTAVTTKAGTGVTTKAGTSVTTKAGVSVETKAGVSAKTKAGVSLDGQAGAIAALKGALVKLN